MKKETKEKLLGGFIVLAIIGFFIPDKEVNKKDVNTSIQIPIKREIVSVELKAKLNTLKGGYGACISEELFDQFVTLSVQKDEKGINYLLKNGCFITREGVDFSLLDRSFTGVSKIRVYAGNETIILWTYNENLNL